MRIVLFLFSSILLVVSCSNNAAAEKTANDNIEAAKDSLKKKQSAVETEGVQGVFEVAPLLTLSIRDTATGEDIGFRVGKAYGAIQEDITALKLEISGSPGGIFYTNDPNKLLFECVIPIKKEPKDKPKHSDVITLDPIKALVYNYYGPFDKISVAYEKIKEYLIANKLEQIGPAREFYITDPTVEKDPAKWLCKIYIPIK